MINFTATLLKFDKKGEKTGWTYIEISAKQANKLKPHTKISFRVKGKMDDCPLKHVALLPVGDGGFILPVNAGLRRKIKKRAGHQVKVALAADLDPFVLSSDLMACLHDDLNALDYFNSLPGSHQRYFSKWIDSAKTAATKAKRIVMAVKALSLKMGYVETIRANKALEWKPAIKKGWVKWMKGVHEVLETGIFVGHKFYKVLSQEDESTVSYCVQYFTPSIEQFNLYLKDHAPALIEAHRKMFKDRHVAFRTLLEEV